MDSPQDMMPWVGLYTAFASLVCTLAMAADVVQGFWQWKLWFPNKFFTLNATSIMLMAIAMKLPVDLTIDTYDGTQVYTRQSSEYTKISSIIFLVIMLANFLPSLGSINDRELLTNMVALGLLVITVTVNTIIQTVTQVHLISIRAITTLIFTLLCPFSVALTVSTCRKQLEHRYKESERLVCSNREKRFSFKELKCYVKKYWMIVETQNPQFVIACSPVSSAFGFICPILVFTSVEMVVDMKQRWYEPLFKTSKKVVNTSDNNWNSEIEECVIQVEDEEKLSKRILRNMFHSITHLLDECEKKEPHNLIKLLEKSTGFNGVLEFENDQVPPLYTEETNFCWSLVVVTLTTIAIALPNIANGHVKGFLVSMREGLQIVRHIEECLNTDVESVKARKAAGCAWTEAEVYHNWARSSKEGPQGKNIKGDS
ncbi:uncharacterized protein LOC143580107 [Bidens hawaiensis]|uniref:uncharacterized protein LOC143580107 n=1 Tax=Bidens hawaiensis TaxID=980011 RepID=UPI00404AF1CC